MNQIGDDGGSALAANTSLRELNVLGNSISYEMSKILVAKKTLIHLSVPSYGINCEENRILNNSLLLKPLFNGPVPVLRRIIKKIFWEYN